MPEDKSKRDFETDADRAESSESAIDDTGIAETEGQAEQDIGTVLQEAEETRDQLLRLAAEFENYKKRMERERETMIKYAGEQVLRELLATLDNLDRAIEQGTGESEDVQKKLDAMLEGVDLTRKGLLSTLEKFEVIPIESVGKPFDPNEQEALTMEPSKDVPANHVLREFARGYRFRDRLLRPAKVVVSGG